MTEELNACPSREDRLSETLAEYLEEAQSNEPPDKEAFIARYPDFADELNEFFADEEMFKQMAGPFQQPMTEPREPIEPPTPLHTPDDPTHILYSDKMDDMPAGTTALISVITSSSKRSLGAASVSSTRPGR